MAELRGISSGLDVLGNVSIIDKVADNYRRAGDMELKMPLPEGFEDLNVLNTGPVKDVLDKLNYTKDRAWAYVVHYHHLYAKWLLGLDDGPVIPVRGYEHISKLEPELWEHIKKSLPDIKQKRSYLYKKFD